MDLKAAEDRTCLTSLFITMHRIRLFEEMLATLIEAGEIKTPCHLYIGQEAVATGICAALGQDDTVWGCHRSHGHYLAKGGDMNALMAEILGKATGCSMGRGGSMHVFDLRVGILGTVPLVGATIPLATGAALAYKIQKQARVSVAFFGDGATEEGVFHESMNLAAAQRLPVVFVVENNLYASHLHILERRGQDNIAMSAGAHGMAGKVLDGNDVEAMRRAAQEAVARAKNGEGPTLLEARTFRWRGHVGPSWDMDVGVQRNDMLQEWLPRDPIAQTRARLLTLGGTSRELDALVAQAQAEVDASVRFARESQYPDPETVSDHVFMTN
jgi:pyruvate dehydrogenase E1 component alpha subunit